MQCQRLRYACDTVFDEACRAGRDAESRLSWVENSDSHPNCVDAIKPAHGREIDWVNLPLDDKPTFDLLNQGKTLGIFQLESGGMQDLARQLHLDKFEEIIAVGAFTVQDRWI